MSILDDSYYGFEDQTVCLNGDTTRPFIVAFLPGPKTSISRLFEKSSVDHPVDPALLSI